VPTVAAAFDALYAVLRTAFFAIAVALAVVALVDWLVRTRRVGPFSPVARFFRQTVDPLMAPVERRVVRAGGLPTAAPWWSLAAVVVAGIIVLSVLSFLRGQLVFLALALAEGGRGVFILLVAWTFGILQIALLVRVVSSWVRVSPYSPWVRWAYVLTEPLLRPLRQFIPPIGGMIDITPIIAYFILRLIESRIVAI
jgi:YggT family protein